MWEFYERSVPIPIKGGIKAQSKRKEFSSSWWGRRWIEALESFHDSARLGRGRSYARKGQVLSISIKNGLIGAKVQGSRKQPYEVEIEIDSLSENAWHLVIDALSKKAIYAARILAGELPNEIEDIFQEVNIQLLPSHHTHLKTDCSCPDWSNPCKHVAAVLYILGEEFDRNPFLLFKIRGMERETFLEHLEKKSLKNKLQKKIDSITEEKELLRIDPEIFWKEEKMQDDWLQGGFEKPNETGLLAKSLGKFPFWHGEQNLFEFIENTYNETTNHAMKCLEKQKNN